MYSNQNSNGYQNPNFAFFDMLGTTPSIFFHNNILYNQSSNSSSSGNYLLVCSNSNFSNIDFSNNIVVNKCNQGDDCRIIYGGSEVFSFNNNLIYDINNALNLNAISNSVDYLWTGFNNAVVSENNTASNEIGAFNNTINTITGTISSSQSFYTTHIQDKGIDNIIYRDIDNSTNDLGLLGGPHTFENYHSTDSQIIGKGRVINLEMPSIIYPFSSENINISGKAIIK